MRRCPHEAYCKHAPDKCRGFLGNPLNFVVGGCPLVPTSKEVEQVRRASGGLSLSGASASGALSVAAEAAD